MDSKVPYLYNGSTLITYEDEQSMAEKASYVNQKGLGDVMIWEISHDPKSVLVNSLYHNILKSHKKQDAEPDFNGLASCLMFYEIFCLKYFF